MPTDPTIDQGSSEDLTPRDIAEKTKGEPLRRLTEMLLFEELLKGEGECRSWSRAVEDLSCLLDTEIGGMRELMRVVKDPLASPDTLTNEEIDGLSAQINVLGEMARAYQKGKRRKQQAGRRKALRS